MNKIYRLSIRKNAIGLSDRDAKKLTKKFYNVRDSYVFISIQGRAEVIADTVSKIDHLGMTSALYIADLIDEGDAFFVNLDCVKLQLSGDEYVELTGDGSSANTIQESVKVGQEKLFESVFNEAYKWNNVDDSVADEIKNIVCKATTCESVEVEDIGDNTYRADFTLTYDDNNADKKVITECEKSGNIDLADWIVDGNGVNVTAVFCTR